MRSHRQMSTKYIANAIQSDRNSLLQNLVIDTTLYFHEIGSGFVPLVPANTKLEAILVPLDGCVAKIQSIGIQIEGIHRVSSSIRLGVGIGKQTDP